MSRRVRLRQPSYPRLSWLLGFRDAVTLTILEDANPDGRAAGHGDNANGVDVNRNFPASNFNSTDPSNGGQPLSEPEARAVVATIDRIAPNLVLVAHSWVGRQFINFDGPAREIAERFSASSGLPVEESSSFAPTPGFVRAPTSAATEESQS